MEKKTGQNCRERDVVKTRGNAWEKDKGKICFYRT